MVSDERLRILTATLFHGTYGLKACRHDTCELQAKDCEVLSAHSFKLVEETICMGTRGRLSVGSYLDSARENLLRYNSYHPCFGLPSHKTRVSRLLFACKQPCGTQVATYRTYKAGTKTDSRYIYSSF